MIKRGRIHLLEWKTGFIEDYMPRDKDSAYGCCRHNYPGWLGL